MTGQFIRSQLVLETPKEDSQLILLLTALSRDRVFLLSLSLTLIEGGDSSDLMMEEEMENLLDFKKGSFPSFNLVISSQYIICDNFTEKPACLQLLNLVLFVLQ